MWSVAEQKSIMYQRLVTVLDALIDVVGENENHPLASLMEVIGVLIEKYEDEHVPKETVPNKALTRHQKPARF